MADPQGGSTTLTPQRQMLSVVGILARLGVGAFVGFKKSQPGPSTTSGGGGGGPEAPKPEAPDTTGVTTVKEYKYVPADKLPPVKGVSQYKWDANQKLLRFSYNVCACLLPVVADHRATDNDDDAVFIKHHVLRVEVLLIDA